MTTADRKLVLPDALLLPPATRVHSKLCNLNQEKSEGNMDKMETRKQLKALYLVRVAQPTGLIDTFAMVLLRVAR